LADVLCHVVPPSVVLITAPAWLPVFTALREARHVVVVGQLIELTVCVVPVFEAAQCVPLSLVEMMVPFSPDAKHVAVDGQDMP